MKATSVAGREFLVRFDDGDELGIGPSDGARDEATGMVMRETDNGEAHGRNRTRRLSLSGTSDKAEQSGKKDQRLLHRGGISRNPKKQRGLTLRFDLKRDRNRAACHSQSFGLTCAALWKKL